MKNVSKKILEVTMEPSGMLLFESDLNLYDKHDMKIISEIVPMTFTTITTSLFGHKERCVTAAIRSLSIGEMACCNDIDKMLSIYCQNVRDISGVLKEAQAEMIRNGLATPVYTKNAKDELNEKRS